MEDRASFSRRATSLASGLPLSGAASAPWAAPGAIAGGSGDAWAAGGGASTPVLFASWARSAAIRVSGEDSATITASSRPSSALSAASAGLAGGPSGAGASRRCGDGSVPGVSRLPWSWALSSAMRRSLASAVAPALGLGGSPRLADRPGAGAAGLVSCRGAATLDEASRARSSASRASAAAARASGESGGSGSAPRVSRARSAASLAPTSTPVALGRLGTPRSKAFLAARRTGGGERSSSGLPGVSRTLLDELADGDLGLVLLLLLLLARGDPATRLAGDPGPLLADAAGLPGPLAGAGGPGSTRGGASPSAGRDGAKCVAPRPRAGRSSPTFPVCQS
mmetsp:Transcript_39318/g.102934  ORF Transcript_39318/g.102934 Transcript_39318/m.102934 type:complete len:339 (-) Transcript_39318:605-1621(-)